MLTEVMVMSPIVSGNMNIILIEIIRSKKSCKGCRITIRRVGKTQYGEMGSRPGIFQESYRYYNRSRMAGKVILNSE
jgi:hypothetical protein